MTGILTSRGPLISGVIYPFDLCAASSALLIILRDSKKLRAFFKVTQLVRKAGLIFQPGWLQCLYTLSQRAEEESSRGAEFDVGQEGMKGTAKEVLGCRHSLPNIVFFEYQLRQYKENGSLAKELIRLTDDTIEKMTRATLCKKESISKVHL